MSSTVWNRFVRTSALLSLAVFGLASVATAKPVPRPGRPRAINLFATSGLLLQGNRIACGIDNVGQVCVAFSGSPVGGGGFWPKGTPDQYIFNSGLQLAGIVDPAAGFAWAGDTAGAFFFDPRGDQRAGDPLVSIYNSLDPSDLASWPPGAVVRDANIYNPVLLGQKSISDGDSWVRYWEGNPVNLGGRVHPMGIMVEQRSMSWNFPAGNEDILYFVFTFYNVTARTASAYANLDPAIQADVAAVGAQFQDQNETKFGIQIPDTGYTLKNLYAAFGMDADVAVFNQNYATAFLPFNIGSEYSGTFLPEVGWRFPNDIFGDPFFAGAGLIGVKYLKSPESSPGVQVGLTMFSNTTNGGTFPDAVGDHLLYRRLSGFLGPGDIQCTPFTDPAVARARHLCALVQTQADARFYQASGPFDLAPGASETIVVAFIQAAPVKVPGVTAGGDLTPGVPFTGDSIFADPSKVRPIDRVAGWVSASDANKDSIIEQNEVVTVPRSLLNKALVAQAVFDAKFLLPNAPAAPPFFLVPGDNQATVVWQKSATETEGDLYFNIASKPYNVDTTTVGGVVKIDSTRNALYDPNFRKFDVEGYRIYRGRTASELQLLAQFDYSGTTIVDYTGSLQYGDLNGDGKVQCAPELGFDAKPPAGDCPIVFDTSYVKTHGFPTDLVGQIIQVKAGDRVLLANGDVLNLKADTAVVGSQTAASGQCGGLPCPALTNTDIPFSFVDHNARNGFTYHYAVTAFDVNSAKSGPSSLESTRITKTVTPRRLASNATATQLTQGVYGSDPSKPLNTIAGYPAIDAATGAFTGNMPPANDGQLTFSSAAVEAFAVGDIAVRYDSITPGFTGGIFLSPAGQPVLYVTVYAGADTVRKAIPLTGAAVNSSGDVDYSFSQPLVRIDSAAARRFGIRLTQDIRMPVTFAAKVSPIVNASAGVSVGVGRFGLLSADTRQTSRFLAHSRWFDGNGTEPPQPTIVGCPDSAHNAGKLTGVGRIWAPQAYRDRTVVGAAAGGCPVTSNLFLRGNAYAQTAWYPADFIVTWNADSSISVRDTTHRLDLPFRANGGSGWGFVNERVFVAAGIAGADLADGTGNPSPAVVGYHHAYGTQPTCFPDWWAITCADLERKAEWQPLDFNADGVGDANGIALMINGEMFIMEMSVIPAAGTKWHLRAVTGNIGASCQPATGPIMTGCSGYTFTGPTTRPSRAPGLTYKVSVTKQFAVDSTVGGDLAHVHTVPDPYYVTNALETTANNKVLNFVNLPAQCIVRIYSVSGILVNVLTHNDPTGGGLLTWNLRNRNNQFVASGVYFYHVEAPDGKTKVGRFTVVNFAP